MKTYKLQQLYNCIYGFLKGTRQNLPNGEKRTSTQIFLCDHCYGNGYFKGKHESTGTICSNCEGTGRVKLEFSVSRVPLSTDFDID